MLILQNWYGRLGNNIKQISNMIHIAIEYKHNIVFNVRHPFFDLNIIENYFNKYNNNEIITNKHNFFNKTQFPYPPEIYEKHVKERNDLLKKSFIVKNVDKLHEKDLVIHIRSGDIFSSFPHPAYVPPPLEYYIKKINQINYRKIIIVCEDTKNPVVNKLLEMYKNSIYNKNSLKKDIEILLGATNVIFSVGSFVPSLMLLSENIKNIYGNYDDNTEELKDYFKTMKPWKNTQIQRNYILTYKY